MRPRSRRKFLLIPSLPRHVGVLTLSLNFNARWLDQDLERRDPTGVQFSVTENDGGECDDAPNARASIHLLFASGTLCKSHIRSESDLSAPLTGAQGSSLAIGLIYATETVALQS